MSDTTETDAILEMRNLGWDQLQDFARRLERERDEARRKYKQAQNYIEKMDAVIDDLKCAKSCINPLEDLKRATLALRERAEKAEAQLADAAGINSPHNACQFRADCRKAEAEIARLSERLEVTHAYVAGKRIEVLAGSIPDGIACRDETIKMQDAEIARLREAALAAQNAAPQSPADLASVPSQEGAGQVVAGAAPIVELTPAIIECLKRGLNCWPEQNNAEGAEIREILKQAEEVKLRIAEDV